MNLIDKWISWIGRFVSWLNVALVLVIVFDVLGRYLFSATSAASFELEWHLFAMIFLLGSSYALQEDSHVRVDVFYSRWSERTQTWINLLGTLVLLLPFCAVVVYESVSFAFQSFIINEGSPDPGGLPARYVVKACIPIGFGLLFLQGLSQVAAHINKLRANG